MKDSRKLLMYKRLKGKHFIEKYYAEYGVMPSAAQVNAAMILTDDELEKIRLKYQIYKLIIAGENYIPDDSSDVPSDDPLQEYLTFDIIGDGKIVWCIENSVGLDTNIKQKTISYSKNGGEWIDITSDKPDNAPSIDVVSGDTVCFRGDNSTYTDSRWVSSFRYSTATFNVRGNIMSLINSNNFAEITTLTGDSNFYSLFRTTNVVDASDLILPASSLTNYCYESMFWRCTSLTTAPAELPATTLAVQCYADMFYECSSLTIAPVLPATTLAERCYERIFQGCSSLTTAPELPATTLERGCYGWMFYGCTSLTTAPELPATTMVDTCYVNMFAGCVRLTTAPVLPATTLAFDCYAWMFLGCTGLTTAPELPVTTLAKSCYNGMFKSCKKLTTAPVLPATTLVDECYREMFSGCKLINSITCLATDISATDCTYRWVYDVAASGTFIKDENTTWSTGINGIPEGWDVLDYGTEDSDSDYEYDYSQDYLTFEILSDGTIIWKASYDSSVIFETISYRINGGNWNSITSSVSGESISVNSGDVVEWKGNNNVYSKYIAGSAPNNMAYNSFRGGTATYNVSGNIMSLINENNFQNLTSFQNQWNFYFLFLGANIISCENLILPATSLTQMCYASMFYGCKYLTTAPTLPAQNLVPNCYYQMFTGCSSLTYIKCLATNISAAGCTSDWVNGVASTGTFVKNPNMSSWTTGNSGIPSGWTVIDNS